MSIIEFESEDFIEYIDRNLEFCMKINISEEDKKTIVEHIKTGTREFIKSVTYKDNTNVMIDEIQLMSKLFEIFDEQTEKVINMSTFLEIFRAFTLKHRNVSLSIDKLVDKIEEHEVQINNKVDKELFDKEVLISVVNFSLMFGCIGFIMSFVNTFKVEGSCYNDTFCDFDDDFMF